MRLYHGTDVRINKPDLAFSRAHKDFGRGFYLTQNQRLAKDWAKMRNRAEAHVNTYDVTLEKIDTCNLHLKRFVTASAEWVEFVYNNREVKSFTHAYDIVIGPIADNGMNKYFHDLRMKRRTYAEVANVLMMTGYKKPLQYCFTSNNALSILKFECYE